MQSFSTLCCFYRYSRYLESTDYAQSTLKYPIVLRYFLMRKIDFSAYNIVTVFNIHTCELKAIIKRAQVLL